MYEIFEKLLKERGIKTSEVARKTGLNPTFFTEWKKGKSKIPKTENLIKIAEYFNVSLEYLTSGIESTKDKYNDIIEMYEILQEEDKKAIYQLLTSLTRKGAKA